MNILTLKSCVFNNFMSYGNNANEFTFPNGLVWMTADNGSGKSTLVEAINFALFGTSYRGGNKSELRNTRNVDGTLRVLLEFDCEKVADVVETYRVTRTISPKGTSKFEVEKYEGDRWVAQSKRAGYSQKDFEETVLGFNEILFKNTIAMNTQESIPFIEMAAKQRRDLLESIIMVTWEPWKKETARRLSAASTSFDIAESDINRINAEIAKLSAICEQLKQEKKQNIALLEQQLAGYQQQLQPVTEKLTGLNSQATAKKTEIDGLAAEAAKEAGVDQAIAKIQAAGLEIGVLSRYRDELSGAEATLERVLAQYNEMPLGTVSAKMSELSAQIADIDSQITTNTVDQRTADSEIKRLSTEQSDVETMGKNLKPGTPCPTCGKPSTEADIEPHKAELRKKYIELRDKIAAKKQEVATLVANMTALNTSKENLTAELEQVKSEAAKITEFYNASVVPAQGAVQRLKASVATSEATVAAAGMDPAQFAAELERLTAEKQKFPEIRQKWQTAYDEWTALSTSISAAQSEYDLVNGNISRLTTEIENAKAKAENDSLAITEKQLEDAKNDLADAELRLHTASDDRLAYDYIGKNMCADDGLKKMIFSQFVPAFNKSVERNIRRLNLPFSLEFDDTMSFTFHSEPGLAPSYTMLSQGQRRKLGFAISMAFRDFVSMVGNFKINFLSMDEVLDVSTDDSGMREMLDIVRDMTEEIGCALVITHRGPVVADKFDYRIAVEYDGNYSTLGEIEKL